MSDPLFWFLVYWSLCFLSVLGWMSRNGKRGSIGVLFWTAILSPLLPFLVIMVLLKKL